MTDEQEIEDLQLGGNIILSGFSEIDRPSMVIVKKMVGNSAKKFQEINSQFEQLKITAKAVHKGDNLPAKKFEIIVNARCGGKNYSSEVTDNNIFVVLDKALKKIEHSLQKE